MAVTMEALLNVLSNLTLKVDNLTTLTVSQSEKIAALQVAQTTSRPRKTTTAGSTPAAVDAQTGQPVEKFPSNTILWLKKKAAEDPSFLPGIVSQTNYNAIETKHAADLAGLADVERRKKMAQKVWTELGELAEKSSNVQTRDHSAKLIKWFKDTWTTERNAFKAANPVPLVAPVSGSVNGGTLIPDTPVFTQPLLTAPTVTTSGFNFTDLPAHLALPTQAAQPPVLQSLPMQSLPVQPLSVQPLSLSLVSPVQLGA